jgi:uncharacterized protein DUF3572
MPKEPRITAEFGENLAIQALGFLAGDPERLGRFLSLAGIGPEMIRAAASDPAFLAGVLDHVASDEPLLLAVADHIGVKPEAVMRARAALSGYYERDVP